MSRVFVLDIATLFDRNRVDDRNRDFEKKVAGAGPVCDDCRRVFRTASRIPGRTVGRIEVIRRLLLLQMTWLGGLLTGRSEFVPDSSETSFVIA